MAKQKIEIDCPYGTKLVWKNNKIEFVPDTIERVKTVDDAKQLLQDSIGTVPYNKSLYDFIDLQIVLKALNGPDFQCNLTKGKIYYPWVRFIRADLVSEVKTDMEKVIGHFKHKGIHYALLGGDTSHSLNGFCFSSGVGYANATLSLLACKDEATACYVSEHFGKLVFMATIGSKIKDIEWID